MTAETVNRVIIRGDGSFEISPNGDWVSARHYDAALAEIERLRKSLPWRDGCNCEGCARMRARYAMHVAASAHPRGDKHE